MKFKLSRQILSPELRRLVSREMRRQKQTVLKITTKELKQLAAASKDIESRGLPRNLVLKKLSGDLGHGIFLHPHAAPIERGQLIASYAGEISVLRQHAPDDGSYAFTPVERMLLTKEEQSVYDKDGSYHPKRLYLLKVDGLKKGNFTRYVNHSEKPNVIAYTMAVPPNRYGLAPGPIEIIYFARKTILPGEQLLVSYEDGDKCYWGRKKPFPITPKTFRLSKTGKLLTLS